MAAQSNSNAHKGGRLVSHDELAAVKTPPPEGLWHPIPHALVLRCVEEALGEAGFEAGRRQLILCRGDARFFGVLDLVGALADGVTLAVGVRNSLDKSFPLGVCAGLRVCGDDLAFSSELLKRKHTPAGEERFRRGVAEAMPLLATFRQGEAARVRVMRATPLRNAEADSLILNAYDKGLVPPTLLRRVIRAWREPLRDFRPRTCWSLYAAVTSVLGQRFQRDPHRHATTTMALGGLFFSQGPLENVAL